ncbi:hypothetical protein KC318_g3794 [Hortaea werneckii]|nr:hypothetical protein KC334_g1401 [Hortaea werneckii]KAI7024408.1 hypothetical protein KC355_g1416 [Hortaea werneckii]KAI7200646.1 hypothetical protein KC324_g2606 [Hortaea werneckii]KAI7591570.1 hypothetical protein KC316_g2799 [Hortaea werneckii]KAI7670885.1 hypothetical protein KC318_g3794 [Hortaea werneckii]
MPTHEEHLAGIEEATGRVRTLKARFNSVENDWCEAAKQLQRVHDIRQKWIDEHGSAPSDLVIQPLLQSSQKLYIRKAREYLAVSREMTALITQRDMQMSMGRMRNVNGRRTESACGSNGLLELKPRTVKGEKKLIAKDEKKKKKKKLSVGNKKKKKLSVKDKRKLSVKRQEEAQRQRQEEAQRQRQEEAQRQEQARAKARARERRDAEQRQERARQEQARRQAHARQEEKTRREREQAQQDSRKRQREQTEQEARKRQKPQPHRFQPPEHNTTAPTTPYGTLTTAQATLEWRTRFLATWPAPFYRTLQAFPAPPPIPCSTPQCCTRTGTQRILKICDKSLRETFKTLSKEELRIQRVKWHPDRFSACPEPHREAYKGMAGEVFVVVNEVYEKKMSGLSCG